MRTPNIALLTLAGTVVLMGVAASTKTVTQAKSEPPGVYGVVHVAVPAGMRSLPAELVAVP